MFKSMMSGTRVVLVLVLLVLLLGILIVFPALARLSLGSLLYTQSQQEFLSYNSGRAIVQAPATWNLLEGELVGADAAAAAPTVLGPAMFASWDNYVEATLDARYEEQNGVSVTIYDLDFVGQYSIQAPQQPTLVELIFPFPGNLDTLHDVSLRVNGVEPPGVQYTTQQIRWQTAMQPGETYDVEVSYKAEGVNSFRYGLYKDRRLSDLDVTIQVKGLGGSEVLESSLPTTDHTTQLRGDTFVWQYSNLVGNRDIELELPQRLSFAQRVAQRQGDFRLLGSLAPFWVGLFLFSLAGLLWLDDRRLPFEAYVLLGLGLALFYPLLIFLGSLMPVLLAAALALVVIALIELMFLSLSGTWVYLVPRAGWLLLIIMGPLSLGLLTPVRGLLLTAGALLLVATLMFFFARRSLRLQTVAPQIAPVEGGQPDSAQAGPQGAPTPAAPSEEQAAPERHCPNCGRALGDADHFCAGCGYALQQFRVCAVCGREQIVPVDVEAAHCLQCGSSLP